MTDIAISSAEYSGIHGDIVALLEHGRRAAARSVNALMTATYWEIGRRIVEFSQGGEGRAAYGQTLLERLSADLTARFGRGFGVDNLELMRVLPDLPASRDFRITDSEIYARRPFRNFRTGDSEIRFRPAREHISAVLDALHPPHAANPVS